MTRPHDRLAAAFAADVATDTARDQRVAASFEPSPQYERLAAMIDSDPEGFARLPRMTRMSTAFYLEQRDAARRVAGEAT